MNHYIRNRYFLLGDIFPRSIVSFSPSSHDNKLIEIEKVRSAEYEKGIYLASNEFVQLLDTNQFLKDFWGNAPQRISQDLLFSYYYHNIQKNKIVLNVQTSNWESLLYFKNTLKDLITGRTNLLSPLSIYSSFARTIGRHPLNLRFGNIHLATDLINDQQIYQIHWDNESPHNIIRSLKHSIVDDILG